MSDSRRLSWAAAIILILCGGGLLAWTVRETRAYWWPTVHVPVRGGQAVADFHNLQYPPGGTLYRLELTVATDSTHAPAVDSGWRSTNPISMEALATEALVGSELVAHVSPDGSEAVWKLPVIGSLLVSALFVLAFGVILTTLLARRIELTRDVLFLFFATGLLSIGIAAAAERYLPGMGWNSSQARVVEASIVTPLAGKSAHTSLYLIYEYTVAGRRILDGDVLRESERSLDFDGVSREPHVGDVITIKTHPDDPHRTLIAKPVDWFWYVWIAGTAVMTSFAWRNFRSSNGASRNLV